MKKRLFWIGLLAFLVIETAMIGPLLRDVKAAFVAINLKYGSSGQSITCTSLNSLANSISVSTGYAGCLPISNATDQFVDALVHVKVTTGTVSGTTPVLNIFVATTSDGGTTYTDGATGTDATQTAISTTVTNWRLLGVCAAPTSSVAVNCPEFSVAGAVGGTLPDHWKIIVQNATGGALAASTNAVWYQGVYAQSN